MREIPLLPACDRDRKLPEMAPNRIENGQLSSTRPTVIPKRPKRRRDRKEPLTISPLAQSYDDMRDLKLESLQRDLDDLERNWRPDVEEYQPPDTNNNRRKNEAVFCNGK